MCRLGATMFSGSQEEAGGRRRQCSSVASHVHVHILIYSELLALNNL